MPYLTTPHWRLINFVVLLLMVAAAVNAWVLKAPVFPAHKNGILFAAFVMTVATILLVKPTPDVGPLRGPALSWLQLRIVTAVLSVAFLLSSGNYYLLDPGFFAPYKRQIFGAMFGLNFLFFVLYEPQLLEFAQKRRSARGAGDT